ncbi:hypothetical protein PM038_00070 [Halorubrum ezzemoulense]|uniref:hypothetical protein n=1 Tax=Halorubrum ezzemoulense TaxID=337243 RepID=UPI00232F8E90|nr:hypothetical protein [Halorubrum ezzemoulense]MDB2283670.1 hypothetical protein [Halorubrum ezzemoulense]
MTTTIYTVLLPEATTPQERESLATELAEQGILNGDSIVDALSTDSADLSLTGQYAYGTYYSELLAGELEELANSQLSGVPLFDGAAARAGYYEIASADVEPVHAGGRDIWEWGLSLTKKGTRKTHFRAVTPAPSEPTAPFGAGDARTTAALPASATLVRALDSRSAPTERVALSPTETVSGAYGDLDIYDVGAISIEDPVIVYDAPKDAQPPVDVHAYDSRGRESKYITADNGRVRAWQSVFDTAHEFAPSAECVLENGLLRVRLDEPDAGDQTASLTAERWDTATDSWTTVDLPSYSDGLATDWVPVDVDLTRIGQASIHALVEFEAVAGDAAGDIFRLDLRLFRGWSDVLVTIPPSESGPVPPALYDRLEPIASGRVVDPGVEQTLVERQEVR